MRDELVQKVLIESLERASGRLMLTVTGDLVPMRVSIREEDDNGRLTVALYVSKNRVSGNSQPTRLVLIHAVARDRGDGRAILTADALLADERRALEADGLHVVRLHDTTARHRQFAANAELYLQL